jgi:hypothetical protein
MEFVCSLFFDKFYHLDEVYKTDGIIFYGDKTYSTIDKLRFILQLKG